MFLQKKIVFFCKRLSAEIKQELMLLDVNILPDNPSSLSAIIPSKMPPFLNEYLFLIDQEFFSYFFLRDVEFFAFIKDFFNRQVH